MEASGWFDHSERFQRLGGGVQLAEAAVDEDQARQSALLLLQLRVAPRDHFAHARRNRRCPPRSG